MNALKRLAETLNNARLYTPAELGQQIMKYVDAKEAAAELTALTAALQAAREVLKPFADLPEFADDIYSSQVKTKDVRAARKALAEIEKVTR